MTATELLEQAKRLHALADVGLLYSNDAYNTERYQEIRSIAQEVMVGITEAPLERLQQSFPTPADYPTAKVDVRGLIVSPEKKVLLIREQADGRWSLPGGWADVGYTAKEVVEKECREETGLEVSVQQLLAVFDKRKHPHPPQPFYVYKFLFACTVTSGTLTKGFDVLDADYFAIDALPPLSEDRILKSQIELGYEKIRRGDTTAYFD